jgi:hypothetical protein
MHQSSGASDFFVAELLAVLDELVRVISAMASEPFFVGNAYRIASFHASHSHSTGCDVPGP